MKCLHLDIETIPTQSATLREELTRPVLEFYAAKHAGIEAEIAGIKPPGNYKTKEAIDKWIAEEKPKKLVVLEEQKKACATECEQKVDEAWRKTSFDGALGQIVVIGFAIDQEKPRTLFQAKDYLTLKAEGMLLREFFQALELVDEKDRQSIIWIGHNIIDFDLRFLYQRAVVHGIKPPRWIPFDSKPWGDRVFDTMLAWAGGRGRVGQDKLCRVLGIDAKGSELGDEIDGSRVWDFVKAGRIQDVATYCGGDVGRAREMHQRLTFAQAA